MTDETRQVDSSAGAFSETGTAAASENAVVEGGSGVEMLLGQALRVVAPPPGDYAVAVSDWEFDLSEAVSGINGAATTPGDVTVTVMAASSEESIIFYKQLEVDGIIGDDDSGIIADFGGADNETSLENLVFTLQSEPTYGQLILVTAGGGTSFLTPGDTFSSEDTIWWIATEDQVADPSTFRSPARRCSRTARSCRNSKPRDQSCL